LNGGISNTWIGIYCANIFALDECTSPFENSESAALHIIFIPETSEQL